MKQILVYGEPDAWGSSVSDSQAVVYRVRFERLANEQGLEVIWVDDPFDVSDEDRAAGEDIFRRVQL